MSSGSGSGMSSGMSSGSGSGMSSGMSSGFFDELERQLVEVAGSPSLVVAASRAPSSRLAAPPSWLVALSLALRRAFRSRPIAAIAASAIFAAIATIAIVDSGDDAGRRSEAGSAPTAQSTRIARTIDASWEGHACSGCYLTDEATLRGGKLGSLIPVRSIAVHVGGENLGRICVWLVSPNGEAAEGSTCSTNAMLAISGTHSEEDAVLTQGITSGRERARAGREGLRAGRGGLRAGRGGLRAGREGLRAGREGVRAGREEPTSGRDEIALAGGT